METNKEYVTGIYWDADFLRYAGYCCKAHKYRFRQHLLSYLELPIDAIHRALSFFTKKYTDSIYSLCCGNKDEKFDFHVINTNLDVRNVANSRMKQYYHAKGIAIATSISRKVLHRRCTTGVKARWRESRFVDLDEVLPELNPSPPKVLFSLFADTYTIDIHADMPRCGCNGNGCPSQSIPIATGATDAYIRAAGAWVAIGVLSRRFSSRNV